MKWAEVRHLGYPSGYVETPSAFSLPVTSPGVADPCLTLRKADPAYGVGGGEGEEVVRGESSGVSFSGVETDPARGRGSSWRM